MDSLDPILAEETVLRRIAEDKMSIDRKSVLPDGFAPHSTRDTDGLSVYRAAFHSASEVASFRLAGKRPVWVAHLMAKDVVGLELTLVPDPLAAKDQLPAQPGHSLIPELNSRNARDEKTMELKRRLASAVIRIDGPFDPPPQA